MHRDLTLIPDDQPGVLARISAAAGSAGVNIEGISAFTGQGKGIIHLLVDDPVRAHAALLEGGFDVRAARDVIVLDIEDRPGAMGETCGRLAEGGINIEQAYLGTNNRLVLVVDDAEGARALLGLPTT